MNQRASHLTAAQIEQYVDDSSGSSEAVETHIQECDECREKALESGRRHLPPGSPAGQHLHPGFPGDDLLMEFAAGLCPPAIASQVLEHVSECEYCAPLLKTYLEGIAGEEAEEEPTGKETTEKAAIQRARKRGLFWFRSFRSKRLAWASGLAFAAVLLIAAVFTAPFALTALNLYQAKTLLASAAREDRVTEMRIPWAPYSKLSPLRGPSDRPRSDRHELSRADAKISDHQDSPDPRWIRANGRVYLLYGDLQKATDLFKRAAEKGLDDPGTKIDLAITYFQNAQAEAQKTGNPDANLIKLNREMATELLLQALESPKISADERAAALFNLAITYEKLQILDMAAQRWKEYLQLDSTSPWADEAREHLKLEQELPPRPQGYRTPGFFLRHLEDPDTQRNIEEYLDVALRSWLLDAMKNKDAEASSALYKLAEVLQEKHGDPWLHDFLKALGPGDSESVHLLANALNNNRRGYHKAAEQAASKAASLFGQHGNVTGTLWANFEDVYAKQRQSKEVMCLEEAQILGKKLERTEYKWLQIQAAFEQAYCYLRKKLFDFAGEKLNFGRQTAAKARFRSLELRGRAIETDLARGSGECTKNWEAAAAGLRQYWEGPSIPSRLYEFYGRFEGCLREEKLLYAARALQERQITIVEEEWNSSDINMRVVASVHQAMADILIELGEQELAQQQAAIAADKAKQLESRAGELGVILKFAEIQLEAQNPQGALNTLDEARASFMAVDDDLIHLKFYELLGDSYLDRQDIDQADAAYERSLELAENGVGTSKEIENRRQWIAEMGVVYRRMTGLLLERKKYAEALQFWEWYQGRSLNAKAASAAQAEKTSWAKIEKEVLAQPLPSPTSETRLVFAGIRNHIHLWTISKAGIESFWLASKAKELSEMVNRFSRRCSDPGSNIFDLEQESERLFSLVLQPALSKIGESDVVIADLDQSMNGLLLEALKSPNGGYFGLRYPVIYSPGFTRELLLRQPVRAMDEAGLLVDASTSTAGPILNNNEREQLLQLVPGLRVLNGAAATPEDMRRGLAASRLFHFLGHGSTNSLELNREWILKLEDFTPKSLQNLQLAVLAACSTGTAKNGLVDSKGLVNAFLAAGVPNVVASHWQVDSMTTADFMKGFYTNLKNDSTPAQALRQARQKLFQIQHHPYYWAAFSLSGRIS
ncbi:MAG TPA: CHAT domain-containing protein [Candidatus Angelobacter sp.]|nr:CHAT domain-containing protein [Candidatus Angelobacter sp.]